MALIKCPECKKKISDQCNSCPHCGYPITSSEENNATSEETFEKKELATENKKTIYKRIWFWVIVGIAVVTIGVALFFIINRDTKPKYDKDGQPVFVELTNEVYTNAKKYRGYHIEIKGQVFQVMGDNGKTKGIQIWLDPDTCEQNLMIYYSTDVEVKQGDYIKCTGYIDSVTKYKNAYDAELHVPLVISKDLQKATYIEVMSPTVESITPENLKQEQFGYSISINKVEFAEKETRIYATATNNGKALMTIGDAIIVQGGKQYNSETNYDAEYEEIPYEVVKGVTCSGVIVFPTIKIEDFELTISVHSDDYDEELGAFMFKISKEGQSSSSNEIQKEESEEETPTSQTQESNGVTNNNTNNNTNTVTISRNQQAVDRANSLADESDFATREWVKDWLMNVDGFSEDEANYALQNTSINWQNEALNAANYIVRESGNASDAQLASGIGFFGPNDLRDGIKAYGYTDAEVAYAMNNCNANWNEIAARSAKVYANNGRDNVIANLLEAGFTQEQANYGADNCGIDWNNR